MTGGQGDHEAFMRAAIAEARAGAAKGNLPVGSVGPIVHPVEVEAEVLPAECLGLLPPDSR